MALYMRKKDCCNQRCNSLSLLFYIISLIFVIVWMGVIFSFSAEPAEESSELSQGVSMQVLCQVQETFPEVITEENIESLAETIETPIRKLAHFTEYAMLGFLISLHLKSLLLWKIRVRGEISIFIGMCYAMTDEFHQIFVPGRAGRLFDVGVDTAGAAFGTLIFCAIFFIIKTIRKRARKKEDKL